MVWIIYAFLANIFFGLCTILDKTLNTKKIKHVYSFALILNTIYFIFALVTTYIQRNTFRMGPSAVYSGIAGVLWFFMWIAFWKALQIGEASRVSALFFSQPIYSAVIGVVMFHETLKATQWIGILVIVSGATLSSLGGHHHKKEVQTAYLFALLAALLSAVGNALSQYAMNGLPPLTVNCIAFYVSIPLYVFLLKDKKVVEEVMLTFKDKRLLFQFGVRGFLGYTGIVLNMLAMGLGPLSLVSAIIGTQPLVILLISLVLTIFLPKIIHEEMGKKIFIPKLAALLVTVLGVIMIGL